MILRKQDKNEANMALQFEYFYGSEAEQFFFYRIPESLMTGPQFADVSLMAKLLYR